MRNNFGRVISQAPPRYEAFIHIQQQKYKTSKGSVGRQLASHLARPARLLHVSRRQHLCTYLASANAVHDIFFLIILAILVERRLIVEVQRRLWVVAKVFCETIAEHPDHLQCHKGERLVVGADNGDLDL